MTILKIAYIRRNNLEMNPNLPKFQLISDNCRITETSKSKRVYSKKFTAQDYDEVKSNTDMMGGALILVNEVFFLSDDLEKKVTRWIEWANQADPKEYDPFA